jgi:hypothetical protein
MTQYGVMKGKNMLRKAMVDVMVLALAAGLGGCKSSQSPIFFTSPSSPYPDVPVPASFTLMTQTTSNMAPATSARYMEHVYQSTDAVGPITQYFRDQLPKQGWAFQTQSQGNDGMLLVFAKGAEVLQIEVAKSLTIRTNVRLTILPAAQR